jgi:MFS family permease
MKSTLLRPGFLSLLVTQFFGAANDNVLKQVLTFMVATGVWAGALGAGGQSYVALCLTLPFILLSGFAGQVADRYSKRTVMVWVKIVEIPIVSLAGLGLLLQNLWLTLGAFLLMAIQSTFFGPAKYGVLPELVGSGDLSRANGAINMLTNIAIIAGVTVAGPLTDLYDPRPDAGTGVLADPMLWVPGATLIGLAVLGLVAVLFVPKLAAADAGLRHSYNPLATYLPALREMATGPLIIIALAWAFFYLIGMMALLILPEYVSILGISYRQNAILLGVLGIAIGVGSLLAGLISGHQIRPKLIPLGAVGMSAAFALLGVLPPRFGLVGLLLFVAGSFAGFYIVPLQALLQKLSPPAERGRFLGTANALSFCFSSLGALLYWVAVNPLRIPPNRVFLLCAVLATAGTGFALIRLWSYIRAHSRV